MSAPKIPDIGIDERIFKNLARKAKFMFSFEGNVHHVLSDGRTCYFDKRQGCYYLQTHSTDMEIDRLLYSLNESEKELSDSLRSLTKSLRLLGEDLGISPSDAINQLELDLDLRHRRNRR